MDWRKQLTSLLPVETVYNDVASPAARQVGAALESTVKAARWLLAPIDWLGAQNDRYQRFLERIANKVPEGRQVEAHPQIAASALDGLRYVPEKSLIAELYLNLLARAIDRERIQEAHPAFTQIIAQLSPDEAMVLFHLRSKSYRYKTYARFDPAAYTFSPREVTENEFPTSELAMPDNYSLYMDHMHSLNLAGIWDQGNQEATYDGEPRVQTGVYISSLAQLTPFGQLFAKACLPEDVSDYDDVIQHTKRMQGTVEDSTP